MKRGLLILILTGMGSFAYGQKDTSRSRLFAPGTLVGKYYGTYDTVAKKDNLADSTLKITNIQASKASKPNLNSGQLSGKSQLQSKVVVDPVELSGTTGVSNIDDHEHQAPQGFSGSGLTTGGIPNLKATIDPFDTTSTEQSTQIQVVGDIDKSLQAGNISGNRALQKNPNIKPPESPKAAPTESYRLTRLGSSSTAYDTYKKNKNGIGSITTSAIKVPVEKSDLKLPDPISETARERLRLTLGSSSPQYDTWKKNDRGFGSITNTPNKSAITPMAEASTDMPAKKDPRSLLKLRLGSSAPGAFTYQENNYGLGKSTTTVK